MLIKSALSFFLFSLLPINFAVGAMSPELKSLIATLQAGKNSPINTIGCSIQKEKWATILLTKQEFVEKVTFNKGCNVEGTNTVKPDVFFPVKLKLRNLKGFSAVSFMLKFNIVFTDKAVLQLNIRKGHLKGKIPEYFEMHYAMAIDPMNPEKFISKRMGGEAAIMSKDFKKVIKRYPIK